MSDRPVFFTYKSSRTVSAEAVHQFLHGALYGAVWGLVTPFPAAGSAAAAQEAATGVFRPVPPFSSFSAIPSSALYFGGILGLQRFCSKSLELVRRQEDGLNEAFGFAMIWPYYRYILNHSEKRLILHNRVVGGIVTASIVYACLLA